MTYLATSINESPVIVEKAGADIADVRGRTVRFDDNGNIELAVAGDAGILGVGIMTNDVNIKAGEDVHVQIKDIGLVYAGAEIKKGAKLSANDDGALVTATDGEVVAIALDAAAAAGVYIKAIILK